MKKPNFKQVKIGIAIACISLCLGIIIGYAATPTTTIWISPGMYPSAPTYTIWKEGSNYFAKDSYGRIAYSGASASTIFSNVQGNYREIYVKSGTYFFSSALSIANRDRLTFRFETGVQLNFTGSFTPLISVVSSSYVVLSGKETVIWNDGAASNRVLLNITSSSSCTFYGLYLHNHNATGGIGILMNAPTGTGLVFNEFQDIKLWRCGIGLLWNATGTGYINRNKFWNVYAHYPLTYGYRLICTYASGNGFYFCEIAHAQIGLSYEVSSVGGNHFYGCTFDTNSNIAIDISYTAHRSLNVIGATIWHTGTGDAINGTFQYGDHFTGIVGDAYSEFVGTATILNGQSSVTISYDCWSTPYTISLTALTDLGGKSLAVTAKNATHATITSSAVVGGDSAIAYHIINFP